MGATVERRTLLRVTVVVGLLIGWAGPALGQPATSSTTSASTTTSTKPAATSKALAAASPAPPFTQCPPIGSSASCAILIVVNPDNSVSVLGDPGIVPFDGIEDTLVGVQNNSSSSVPGLKLSSSLSIFSFDGDGICTVTGAPAGCPFGPTGYEGPNTSFVPTTSTIGNVLFTNGGLAAGRSTYFGLEEQVQAAQLLVNTTHYRIDMKAWIPQASVVDPEQPITLSYPLAAVIHFPCHVPSPFLIPFTTVSTRYQGDGHAGFDGSYRVMSSVEFDWDGKQVLNTRVPTDPHFGTTHLLATYSNFLNTTNCELASGTATSATSASATGTSFAVSYSAANPVVRLPAPAIDGDTTGTVAADGTVSFHFRTDLFPSHGVRVSKDGAPQLTDIVNDASCLPNFAVRGLVGLGVIATGLSTQSNQGDRTVSPNDAGRTASHNSALCLGF